MKDIFSIGGRECKQFPSSPTFMLYLLHCHSGTFSRPRGSSIIKTRLRTALALSHSLNMEGNRTVLDTRLLAGNFTQQVLPMEGTTLCHCVIQYSFRCCHISVCRFKIISFLSNIKTFCQERNIFSSFFNINTSVFLLNPALKDTCS